MLLSEYICKRYGHDQMIDHLINNTRIHIMPMLNPDGAMKAVEGDCSSNKGRMNANGIDLNNDFQGSFCCFFYLFDRAANYFQNLIDSRFISNRKLKRYSFAEIVAKILYCC